ncbi:MAG: YkgJ family cysteine cluster protein [Pseudomonadota bacterium]
MECRTECGGCCIAPSIQTPIPGMPHGKPAGVACINLETGTKRCRLWGTEQYPELCRRFQASPDNCGSSAIEALQILTLLEQQTSH